MDHTIRVKEKLAYAALSFGQSTVAIVVSTYILYYYTDVLFLPAAAVSVLLFAVRIFDGAIDPFIGYYMDKRETKLGKFRGYPLYWSIPFCACSVLLFYPFTGSKGMALAFSYVLYFLWSLSYSMIEESTNALSMTISAEPEQRQILNTFKIVASIIGNLLVSYSALLLVDYFGGGNEQRGYILTVLLFAVICFVCIAPGMLVIRERNAATVNPYNPFKCIRLIAGDKSFALFLLMYFTHQMASALKSQSAIYYMKYAVDRMDLLPIFLLVGRFSNLCAQPLIVFLARRLPMNRLMYAGYCAAGAGMLLIGLSNASLVMLFLGSVISGMGSAFPANLALTRMAEISDRLSRRNANGSFSAMVASCYGLTSKFGAAMGGGLVAMMLHLTAYVPNVEQHRPAMLGIQLTYTGLTAALYLTAGLFALLSHRVTAGKQEMVNAAE